MKMKSFITMLLMVASCSVIAFAAPPATMRLEYFHTGNSAQELFSVDRVVIEPLPWPGNPQKAIDTTNRGNYIVEVVDAGSQRVLYSRGFSSIYGEWATTDEAKQANRTFHESLRFPEPQSSVRVVLKKRDAQNRFQQIWSTVVDPKDKSIDRGPHAAPATVIEIEKNGDPSEKVDLLLLGEGYTARESGKCKADVRRLTAGIFAVSPFKERRSDFNVWAICAPALESGVSHPSKGIHRNTLFGSTFDVFGTERYALSFDDHAIRTIAASAPYDVLGIVMNEKEYGNGGIFGLYASVSIDYPTGVSVFVHEFGHHFAGLGDEYYFNANVAYAPASRVEPWEPNITALLDPKDLKWKSLVDANTPLPTPWEKQAYENSIRELSKEMERMRAEKRSAAEIDARKRAGRAAQEGALGSGPYAGKVGAFEGAMYEEKGFYRSQQRCIMISGTEFCAACRRGIEDIIDLYSAR
jgi:hypothetical protein